MSWGLHKRLLNVFQFTVPVSGSQFSGSQAVFTEVSGTTAQFANYTGPAGGSATFASASINNAVLTGSLFGTASFANRAISASHALRADSAPIDFVTNVLTSSVSLPGFSSFGNVLSITVPIGTWLVTAHCSVIANIQDATFMRVGTGSLIYASSVGSPGYSAALPYAAGMSVSFPLVATESIELTLQAGYRGSAGSPTAMSTLQTPAGGFGYGAQGAGTTQITAYKIG